MVRSLLFWFTSFPLSLSTNGLSRRAEQQRPSFSPASVPVGSRFSLFLQRVVQPQKYRGSTCSSHAAGRAIRGSDNRSPSDFLSPDGKDFPRNGCFAFGSDSPQTFSSDFTRTVITVPAASHRSQMPTPCVLQVTAHVLTPFTGQSVHKNTQRSRVFAQQKKHVFSFVSFFHHI